MAVPSKPVALILSVLAVLAACSPSPDRDAAAAPAAASPPPVLTGALGAQRAPAARMPLSGGTTAPAPVAMPGAAVRLSATDIVDMLSGNTVQGATAEGLSYAVYFRSDGEERFRQGSFNDAGTWRVLPDGRLCSALIRVSNDNQQCYFMHRSGDTVTFQSPDGVTLGSVKVVSGNPQRL